MASGQLQAVVGQLRRLVGKRSGCTLTDAQLVENFVSRRDEASFEVLVWRHGAMILRLCQRVLRDSHEAEDAFQATFLVFARKAGAIGKGAAVGSWLYKVAYRIALRVRARAAHRGDGNVCGEMLDEVAAPAAVDEVLWRDLRPVLDEEIDRLPEKYRAPFVLCYLEGHTNEEAAAQLGCPKGTVLSRLARGRQQLRSRLSRRGLAVSVGGLTAALSQGAAPAALVSSTTEAALTFAAGKATAGLVSSSALALTQGVLNAMFLTKVKIAVAALLALAVVGFGVSSWSQRAQADTPGTRDSAAALVAQERVNEAVAGDKTKPSGKVIDVAKDGKGFTLEISARADDEAKKVFVKINDKTTVSYQNVGPNGAKPTAGYRAQVKLEDNSNDVAATVTFHGPEAARPDADLVGKVVGVAKDGKGITVEGGAGKRDEEPKKVEVQFNAKTQLLFSGIAKGGAKIAEGYKVKVSLLHGDKGNTAAIVEFTGTEAGESRDDPTPDATGKIVSVAADGKTISLEMPGKARDDPPSKIDIKIGAKTVIAFQKVGLDGTKIAEGQIARAWLEAGSKDTAAKVSVKAVPPDRWTLVKGKVVGIAKEGSTFTVEVAGKSRDEDAKKVDIKLTLDTKISYSGVGPEEAKMTEGYQAHVWLADGTTDTAYQVIFTKPGSGGSR